MLLHGLFLAAYDRNDDVHVVSLWPAGTPPFQCAAEDRLRIVLRLAFLINI